MNTDYLHGYPLDYKSVIFPMSNNSVEVGKRIRAARKRAGFTLVQLAKVVGQTQPNLSDIENGKNAGSETILKFLAFVLHDDFGLTWLAEFARGDLASVPIVGWVAAGAPIEFYQESEPKMIDVPFSMIRGNKKMICLRVVGDSMVDEGIFEGDLLIVAQNSVAEDGQVVIACVNNTITVKRFRRRRDCIILEPANKKHNELKFFPTDQPPVIQGIVTGVIRMFERGA